MTNSISIEEYSDAHARDWNEYVLARGDGTFFHLIEWREIIERAGLEPRYLLARQNGAICGVLPLAHVSSVLFGNHLISAPFCVYGGPLADSESVLDQLIGAARDLAGTLGVGDFEMRNRRTLPGDYPAKSLYCTFRRDISASEEDNLAAIPRKQRAMVRKAIKLELSSEFTDDVDQFYSIYSESVRNLGTPVFSKTHFQLLREIFPKSQDMMIVKSPDGKPVAAVMSFYFKNEVLPYYGGSISEARELKANDFMYWQLMCHAARRGATLFDFGRSKIGSGPYSFKKNWGFQPEPLAYQYVLINSRSIPEVNPQNPKYRYFIEAWKRLPLPVANRVGPMLSKYLG